MEIEWIIIVRALFLIVQFYLVTYWKYNFIKMYMSDFVVNGLLMYKLFKWAEIWWHLAFNFWTRHNIIIIYVYFPSWYSVSYNPCVGFF